MTFTYLLLFVTNILPFLSLFSGNFIITKKKLICKLPTKILSQKIQICTMNPQLIPPATNHIPFHLWSFSPQSFQNQPNASLNLDPADLSRPSRKFKFPPFFSFNSPSQKLAAPFYELLSSSCEFVFVPQLVLFQKPEKPSVVLSGALWFVAATGDDDEDQRERQRGRRSAQESCGSS